MKVFVAAVLACFVLGVSAENHIVIREGGSLPGSSYEAQLVGNDFIFDASLFSQTQLADKDSAFLVKTQTTATKLQVQQARINAIATSVTWFPDETYAVLIVPNTYLPKLDDALFLCQLEKLDFIEHADVPEFSVDIDDSDEGALNKQAIVNSMGVNDYTETLGLLSGARTHPNGRIIRTRQSTTADYQFASQYMADWMVATGVCDDIRFQTFTVQGRQSRNVICIKTGTTQANQIVVVGGHLDSTSEQSTTLAPGAVDDGSGTVGVMVIAKAFAPYSFSRTIHFIGFGGEEQGLVGSTYYVNQLGNNGFNVVSAYLQDMTAYSNRFYGVTIEGTSNGAIQQLMQIQQRNVNDLTRLTSRQSNNSFGSDHVPFQRAGIPAILLIEQDDTNYPHYHRSTDSLDKTTPEQGNDIAKAVAGAAYDSAGFVGMK